MPTITLHIGPDGKPAGITEKDDRLYTAFKYRLKDLGKESITFSWKEPRSGPYHRRHFAMINAIYEGQEQFQDQDMFRKWLEVGAGYAEFCPSSTGKMCAIPKSIAYDKLDQKEFQEVHEAIFQFARSLHATRFLWPHLSDKEAGEMIEALLREFES